MKKTRAPFPALLMLTLLAFAPVTPAAGDALGIDFVRLADRNQDDGMFNLFYQRNLSSSSALVLGYASGQTSTVFDFAWKAYSQRNHQGVFYQVGVAWYDAEDSALGITLALGHEWWLARRLAMSVAAKVVLVDIEEKRLGLRYGEDPIFQPAAAMKFTF